MPSNRTIVLAAVGNPNVRKFLDLIGAAEGADYTTAFGGGTIESLEDHPRARHSFKQTDGKRNTTTAAGRYQFLERTWDDVAKSLNLTDFSPMSQDLGAVELLRRNGALDAVLAGDFATALKKSGGTWASLPSSPYPQPRRSQEFVDQFLAGNAPSQVPAPAQRTDTPRMATTPQPLETAAAQPLALPSPEAVQGVFDALAGAPPATASNEPPAWAQAVSSVQNRQIMEEAIANEDRENRGRAVAAFTGGTYVPELVIPQAIEDSISRYMAQL